MRGLQMQAVLLLAALSNTIMQPFNTNQQTYWKEKRPDEVKRALLRDAESKRERRRMRRLKRGY